MPPTPTPTAAELISSVSPATTTATKIDLSTITSGTIVDGKWEGSGIFDVLMKAVTANIETQYRESRITGTDFSTIYLGSIQAILSQSISYALQVGAAEKGIDQAAATIATLDTERAFSAHTTASSLLSAEQDRALKEETTSSTLLSQEQERTLKADHSVADLKLKYVERVAKDKAVVAMGLDETIKTANTSPDAIYSCKYIE